VPARLLLYIPRAVMFCTSLLVDLAVRRVSMQLALYSDKSSQTRSRQDGSRMERNISDSNRAKANSNTKANGDAQVQVQVRGSTALWWLKSAWPMLVLANRTFSNATELALVAVCWMLAIPSRRRTAVSRSYHSVDFERTFLCRLIWAARCIRIVQKTYIYF
jgi:hypothetical protein